MRRLLLKAKMTAPPPIGQLAARYVQFLSERSIVDRLFGQISLFGHHPFRDHVDVLEHDAMGMFFYNQRALFFGAAGIFLLLSTPFLKLSSAPSALIKAWTVLAGAWFIGGTLTLALHSQFRRELDRWAAAHRPLALPPIYDKYFLLDCALLSVVVVIGWRLTLPFGGLAFLLCANIIVYSAYTFIGHSSRLTRTVLIGLFILALLFLPLWSPYGGDVLNTILTALPVAIMLLVTLFSVTMMSALATIGHRVTRAQLSLLGEYQNMLLGDTAVDSTTSSSEPLHSDKQFSKRLRAVLRDLCTRHREFWYRSAAAWFVTHHDDRGRVLMLGPYENMTELASYRSGIDASTGFLATNEVLLLHSLKAQVGTDADRWRLRLELDAPAALVPLKRGDDQVGALLLYGDEHSPPVPREDEQFLASLSSTIVNSWDQWRARYSTAAHKELDRLFVVERIEELFPAAVRVLAKYLFADGCMLVFRPDPKSTHMHVAAVAGFDRTIIGAEYEAGVGQTGKCASAGTVIRVDDVAPHREAFDGTWLRRLERAHGKSVKSWMAIPIGKEPRNYGVIKIVNRTEGPYWFTADDERLAEDLALRLQVTIENFLHIARTEAAKNEAQQNASNARHAQAEAEAAARERLQDLMTITHQMQGPLVGVIGALSGVTASLPTTDADLIEHAQALVEDAITVGYGTFTTFALKAGRSTAFFDNEIDAVKELQRLATRLQRTNPRPEIRFVFREEQGFPMLRFDGRVFTSVLYSLIHNALKYADDYTDVFLECSYERSTDEPAVKVKSTGAPIFIAEKDAIFEQFTRGRSVEHGQLYTGVGLGLWVARQLMRALGGDLTLELSAENSRFSVFIVHFPVSAVKRRR